MMAVKREDLIAQILDLAEIPLIASVIGLSTKRSSLSQKQQDSSSRYFSKLKCILGIFSFETQPRLRCDPA